MRTLSNERKRNIFLALTKFHRDINNGINPSFHKTFKEFGFGNNQNLVVNIRKAMLNMRIIAYKDHKYYWSTERTLPNPKLVDGILKTIKDTSTSDVKIKVKVTPPTNKVVKTDVQLEELLKSLTKAGINPNIIIICK